MLEMLVGSPLNNIGDGCWSDPVSLSDVPISRASLLVLDPDGCNISGSQLVWESSLVERVINIVSAGSEEEMMGVDASSIVTGMANEQTGLDESPVERPGNSVGQSSLVEEIEVPIPVVIDWASPIPTFFSALSPRGIKPKSVEYGHMDACRHSLILSHGDC